MPAPLDTASMAADESGRCMTTVERGGSGLRITVTVLIGVFICATTSKEIIELDAVRLKRRRLLLDLGPSREYRGADIRDLRPAPYIPSASPDQP